MSSDLACQITTASSRSNQQDLSVCRTTCVPRLPKETCLSITNVCSKPKCFSSMFSCSWPRDHVSIYVCSQNHVILSEKFINLIDIERQTLIFHPMATPFSFVVSFLVLTIYSGHRLTAPKFLDIHFHQNLANIQSN